MSLLLIDDQGELWNGQSRQLRQAFDSPYSGGEFTEYAVVNLGFIAVNTYGASAQVRLRPAFTSDKTITALRRWLSQSRSERIVLSWLGSEWTSELLRGGAALQSRLQELFDTAHHPAPNEYLARDLGEPDLHPKSPLGQLVRSWERLSQPVGLPELMKLLETTFGDRYVIVRPAESGKLLFHAFGGGLYSDYETWRHCAIGAPIEEQPDRHFGRWVNSAYAATLVRNVPSVSNVDAIVRWPHRGRARMRYKRVIVPMQGAGSAPLLLGGSLIDNGIDLRVGLG